jgi:hypothetical protein
MAAVAVRAVACPAPRAGQAAGVQPGDEIGVAGVLVHQVTDGEVHDGPRPGRDNGSTLITSPRPRAVKPSHQVPDMSLRCFGTMPIESLHNNGSSL